MTHPAIKPSADVLTVVLAAAALACEGAVERSPADLVVTELDTVISLESELLAAPADLAVDAAGRVYVLDYQFAGILVLPGPGGSPVLYGGEGEGPGEFNGPEALSVSDDSIRVIELGNGRVQVLATDGTHGRSYPLPVAFPGGISISPAGVLAVPTQGFREDSLVLVFDADGSPAGRVGAPVVPPHQMWDLTEIRSAIDGDRVPNSLRNMSLPVIEDDGSLWLILNAEGIVRRYDSDGTLLWSLELASPELASIKDEFFTRNRELTTPGFVVLSYVSDACLVDGTLWLLLNTPADQPTVVLVVAEDGTLERRLRLPDLSNAGDIAVDLPRRRLYLTVPDDAALVAAMLPD
jgi:hypothetical protein